MQMDRVYMIPLGFNFIKWLGDHLLKPIIDAIVKILDPIFTGFLDFLGDMIVKMLAGVFYAIYTSLLSMVIFCPVRGRSIPLREALHWKTIC